MKTYIFIIAMVLTAVLHTAEAQNISSTYGARLEGFEYPYPVQNFPLTSQGQTIEMSYMDITPSTDGNGETVVLLHGKNFCGATWEATIKELSDKGYRIIVPDQIGFCKSSKPQTYQYSFNQLALNTHELLQSLGVSQYILIGHSMGGMLAARYAINYPQEVSQLVLVNPIGLEDWQAKGVPYASVNTLYANELKTSFESIKSYQLKFYYDGIWKPEYDRWVDMQAGLYAGEGKEIVALSQARTSDMIFTQPVVHEFPRIKTPTLLIIGGKDRTAPGANRAPKELAERLGDYSALGQQAAAAIPQSKLINLPELGHSPQVEAPDIFHDVLLKNLQ